MKAHQRRLALFFTSNDGEIASLAGLLRGGYYFNAHSEANPAGEVRGQITAGDTQVVRVEDADRTRSSAVVTPAAEDVSGVGYFTFNATNPLVLPVANVSVSGFKLLWFTFIAVVLQVLLVQFRLA